jgi:hypothetical protein
VPLLFAAGGRRHFRIETQYQENQHMRTFRIVSATLLLAAVSLTGCSAGDVSEEGAGPTQVSEDPPHTIAEVDVGYGKVIFQQTEGAEGGVEISVAELSPNDYGSTPFHSIASLGQHTMLELFLAVAPDQEAPQSLVDAHELQTQQLFRESSELVVPEFDRDAPIEKVTQACRNFVTPPYGICRYYSTNSEKDAQYADGLNLGSASFYTNGPVHQGLCNNSSQTITAKMLRRWEDASQFVGLSTYAQHNVPAGQKVTEFTQFHFDPRGRYRVTGTPVMPWSPASYSLRSGQLSVNHEQCPGEPPWLP